MPTSIAVGTAALLFLAVVSFWPTYLSKPPSSIDGYTHAHAALGLLWMALLGTQALLVRRRLLAAHRAFGRASCLLAPLFVLSSVLLAHHRFSRMDAVTFEQEAHTLYLPLSAAALFACAYGLALRHRAAVALHSRFMACTGLLLVDPVLGRFLAFHVVDFPQFWHYQVVTFGAELACLVWLCRTIPRPEPGRAVFARFAGLYATVLMLWFVVPRSEHWLPLAEWFRRLTLT